MICYSKIKPDSNFLLIVGLLLIWYIFAGTPYSSSAVIASLEKSTDLSLWSDALLSDDREVREFAAKNILEKVPHDELTQLAVQLSKSDIQSENITGLKLLDKLEVSDKGSLVQSFLNSQSPEILFATLRILSRDPVDSAESRIIELTDHPDSTVQAAAILALASYGNPDNLETFINFLSRPHEEIRKNARIGVITIAKKSDRVVPIVLNLALGHEINTARESILILGEIESELALDGLFHCLSYGHPSLANDTIDAIGKIGGDLAYDKTRKLFASGTELEKTRAARLFGVLGNHDAAPLMWETASNPNNEANLRAYAIESLGKIGDESYIDPLIEIIENRQNDPRLIRSAIEALGGIGGEKVLNLYDDVIDRDFDFGLNFTGRKSALLSVIAGLGKMNSDESRTRLRKIIAEQDLENLDVLTVAVRALGEVGDISDILLLENLSEEYPILEIAVKDSKEKIESRFPK